MNEQTFLQEVKEIDLLEQAAALLEWDEQTGMPEASSPFRAEVTSYLSSMAFDRKNSGVIEEAIAYYSTHETELSELGTEVFTKIKEDYELNHSIPSDRYQAFSKAVSLAHAAWQKARAGKVFDLMKQELGDNIAYLKEFIPYWRKEETTNYDVLLNQYEPGMTAAELDAIFDQLREGIMSIRQTIADKGTQPVTEFLSRTVTKEQQKRFVVEVVKQLGYDFERGRLDDTIHPFMLDLNRNDARITTRWNEQDFQMATFGVIHEAGHGIYEQNVAAKYDYTPLSTGASMGMHESQSLFYEIIVGSNRAFWEKQYPFFQECTEGTFADIDFETFYRSLKESKASLIRIEADSLTYPVHIIIRYEIEKMIFDGDVEIDDLPEIWNDKYEEYLGIRPENDLDGILQDVHWSGASFGYFPSYALGFMYAAQLRHAMSQELDIDQVLASDDYSPIRAWLTEHIHQYGASRKPKQLIMDATGEALNPQYLIDYMKQLYFDVYQING